MTSRIELSSLEHLSAETSVHDLFRARTSAMHLALRSSQLAQGILSPEVTVLHVRFFLEILYQTSLAVEGGTSLLPYQHLEDNIRLLGGKPETLSPLPLKSSYKASRYGHIYVLQGAHRGASIVAGQVYSFRPEWPKLSFFEQNTETQMAWEKLINFLEKMTLDEIDQAIFGVDSCFSAVFQAIIAIESKLPTIDF